MKTRIGKNERVLNLLACLLRSRQPVPYCRIRSAVDGYNDTQTAEATVARRFERDKETLRALGLEILYGDDPFSGAPGYFIPKPGAYLGDVDLSDREARLVMVLAAFSSERKGALVENLASACQKLLARSVMHEPVAAEARHHLVHPAKTVSSRTVPANLELLGEALERRRRVLFTYYSIHRDSVGRRAVEPYALKFFKGEWYLVGKCVDAGEVRIFRLDRMKGRVRFAEGACGDYEIPAGFSVGDYVGRSPWQLSRKAPVEVTVDLDDVGAWLVEEARFSGLELDAKGKRRVARVSVANEEGFFKWLVSLGTHARIARPRAVAERFVAFVGRLEAQCPA